jgi:hypothetical protein
MTKMGLNKNEIAECVQSLCEINILRICYLSFYCFLRETFGSSSGAPEELPKDVQRNPEADTKAEHPRPANPASGGRRRITLNALSWKAPVFWSNGFMWGKINFTEALYTLCNFPVS